MSISRPSGGWNIRGKTTHPGVILEEDFLKPLGMTRNNLAMEIRVPANRIGEIVKGERAVTPETALRLARFFGNSAEFWLGLQQGYDLSSARDAAEERIAREVLPRIHDTAIAAAGVLPTQRADKSVPASKRRIDQRPRVRRISA